MKIVLLETFLGFLLSIVGFGVIFLSLTLTPGGILNLILLVIGLILVFFGVYILYKAGTRDVQKPNFEYPIVPADGEKKSILERNQELIDDYNKTMRVRDKLKILKMSANSEAK